MSAQRFTTALVACAVLAACMDDPPTSPSLGDFGTSAAQINPEEICQAITFDDLGLSHGDDITGSIYLTSLFPDPLTISLTRGDGNGSANQNPVAFDTQINPALTEEDLQYDMSIGGECNTAVNGPRDASLGNFNPVTGQPLGPGGFDDCEDSGIIMVVEDDAGFAAEGNDNQGGTFTITGFPAGVVYLKSFETVDNDDFEAPDYAEVDGSTVAVGSSLGNGVVEKVDASTFPLINTSAAFTVTASGGVDNLQFCKTPPRENGRMTGGGVKATGSEGEIVTFGLTLHCDITLSNNLEVNWKGHQWHLDKPITDAVCSNIRPFDAPPPASPINVFEGEGYGRLDNVDGSFVEFRFEDHGEPGRDDMVEITIYEPGSSNVALYIPPQKISVGNWQMHYDQPHGQKP